MVEKWVVEWFLLGSRVPLYSTEIELINNNFKIHTMNTPMNIIIEFDKYFVIFEL